MPPCCKQRIMIIKWVLGLTVHCLYFFKYKIQYQCIQYQCTKSSQNQLRMKHDENQFSGNIVWSLYYLKAVQVLWINFALLVEVLLVTKWKNRLKSPGDLMFHCEVCWTAFTMTWRGSRSVWVICARSRCRAKAWAKTFVSFFFVLLFKENFRPWLDSLYPWSSLIP